MDNKQTKDIELKNEIEELSKNDYNILCDIFTQTSPEHLFELKTYLDNLYYNTGEPSGFTDSQYDILKDILEQKDELNSTVGAEVFEENRVKLPYFLGSMDKIKNIEPKKLTLWVKNNPSDEYILEDKLDGVSCLLVSKDNEIKLYKRGDGSIGPNISYFAKFFNSIPKSLPDIAIRGELVMKTKTFLEKYPENSNPRNFVNGRTNGKTARDGLNDIDFVAYEIMNDDISFEPLEQIKKLQNLGFLTVNYNIVQKLDVDDLFNRLKDFEKKSEYELDGLVMISNLKYKHNDDRYPRYSRAFKVNFSENIKETTVIKVEWKVSRFKTLTPVVHIEPIMISGALISRATAHNAKYILDNNIGPGSVLKVTRSGCVIPLIVSVVKPTIAQMPDISYKWGITEIDIYTEEESEKVMVKMITTFFFQLGIKHVGESAVSKLCENGFDSLFKILDASKFDLKKINRFGEKTVNRLYTNIHEGLQNVSLAAVIGASGVFDSGIGIKRMNSLLKEIPDLFDIYKKISREELIDKIIKIEGFSHKMGNQIAENIQTADEFIKKLSKYATFKEIKIKEIKIKEDFIESKLTNKIFVFSGFRDNSFQDKIISQGGFVKNAISKNTNFLIVKDKTENTTKTTKANELNIPIYTLEEFLENFLEE